MDNLTASWSSRASVGPTRWCPASGPTFRSFASQFVGTALVASTSHCDARADLSRFTAAFNPKYDVVRPTHLELNTLNNVAFVLVKSVAFKVYMDWVMAANNWIDDVQDGKDGPDFADFFTNFPYWRSVKQGMLMGGFDLITQNVRIAYAKLVCDRWDTRTVWKMLKAAPQSAIRKLHKSGFLAVPSVFRTIVRGNMLQRASELTVSVCVQLPLRCYLRRPPRLREYVKRSLAEAVILCTCRTAVLALGQTVALTLCYYTGSASSPQAVDSAPMPKVMFWTTALAALASDYCVQFFVAQELSAWVEEGQREVAM